MPQNVFLMHGSVLKLYLTLDISESNAVDKAYEDIQICLTQH